MSLFTGLQFVQTIS